MEAVLRRANSEEEARKIFAQAEAALDTEQSTPVGADVRASRTIRMLGEEYLKDSIERGKQPRTMEQRVSRLNMGCPLAPVGRIASKLSTVISRIRDMTDWIDPSGWLRDAYGGPGGGLYTGPGGGLYTGPSGGAYSGPPASPQRRNWPPIPTLLAHLRSIGYAAEANLIARVYGLD